MIWKLAPVVSKSLSTLAPIVTARREVNICRQGRKRKWVLSHLGPQAVESSENKKVKKGKGGKKGGRPGRSSFGRVGKQWLAAQRMVLPLFFSSINIWALACIYPHSLFMNRPGKNAGGEEGGKAKARDSSNQSCFKWHWVTEPGVLWLSVQMRHCALVLKKKKKSTLPHH